MTDSSGNDLIRPHSALGLFAAIWGAAGLVGLLVFAIVRLCGVVWAGLDAPWQWHHIVVAAANTAFMAWSEGYRGFQQGFSPRCAARVKWLLVHPTWRTAVLAPLFVMGYFASTRRRKIVVYGLTVGIVIAIIIIHALSQPWRAALDIGVVVGLTWGVVSFAAALSAALRVPADRANAEVPP